MLNGCNIIIYSPTSSAVFLLFHLLYCAWVLNCSHPVNSFVGLRCTYSVVVIPFTNDYIIQYLLGTADNVITYTPTLLHRTTNT